MVQRGFRDAREAAATERRNAEMLRSLSSFLTDPSVFLDAGGSLSEMLRLVAEEARELSGAQCCIVTTAGRQQRPAVRAASAEGDLGWTAFVRWTDFARVDELARSAGGPVRVSPGEMSLNASHDQIPSAAPVRDWLVAPLTALDGRHLRSIQVLTSGERAFRPLDEAVLVHLAQMSAATVERVAYYTQARQPTPTERQPRC